MSDYRFKLKAQQWRDDPYYVASSAPVHEVEAIAPTKQVAINKAAEMLGPAQRHWYWKFWVLSSEEVPSPPVDHDLTAVTRRQLETAIGSVLFNASNFPEAVQARLLGQDMAPLRTRLVDAVLALIPQPEGSTILEEAPRG